MATVHTVMQATLDSAHWVLKALLADLSDDDLLVRPVPSANHIAWQLGHLIRSEHGMMSEVPSSDLPPLPTGFRDRYTEETSKSDDRGLFGGKSFYLDLYGGVRAATLQTLNRLTEAQLREPSPESFRAYAPTVADIIALQGNHELMHAGQFTVVRRKLGKPQAM